MKSVERLFAEQLRHRHRRGDLLSAAYQLAPDGNVYWKIAQLMPALGGAVEERSVQIFREIVLTLLAEAESLKGKE